MQYKTIVLQLLEDRPEIHEQLRSRRQLLPTMEHYAAELRANHEAWKRELARSRPDSDPIQIANEALEIALQELQELLPSVLQLNDSEPLSLDGAMAYLHAHTPAA